MKHEMYRPEFYESLVAGGDVQKYNEYGPSSSAAGVTLPTPTATFNTPWLRLPSMEPACEQIVEPC